MTRAKNETRTLSILSADEATDLDSLLDEIVNKSATSEYGKTAEAVDNLKC